MSNTSKAPRRWAKFLVESSPTSRFQTLTTALLESSILALLFIIESKKEKEKEKEKEKRFQKEKEEESQYDQIKSRSRKKRALGMKKHVGIA